MTACELAKNLKNLKALPSPSGWPIIGTLGQLIAAGGAPKLHEYVDRRHRELGPIYKEKIGPTTGVFVSEPTLMRRVFAVEGKCPRHIIPDSWAVFNRIYGQQRGLLFMDGQEWQLFRKILNNIILKPDVNYTVEALEIVSENLSNKLKTGNEITNLENELYMWSLQSIIAVLLGPKSYQAIGHQLQPLSEELSTKVRQVFIESSKLSLIPAKLANKIGLPVWKRFVNVVQDSMRIANLLVLELEKSSNEGIFNTLSISIDNKRDLQRIVSDLILAAGDTTAYTFQWLLYLLGTHQEEQKCLQQVCRTLDLQAALNHPLIKGTLRETLRLYPVAPFITRYLPEDTDIGGYFVKKGEMMIMSLYTSGRNENYFPNALAFKPDRWERDEKAYKAVNSPYASLPFAMGPRSCIGRRIAELQITLALIKVLQKFTVRVLNEQPVGIQLQLITTPDTPIRVQLAPAREP